MYVDEKFFQTRIITAGDTLNPNLFSIKYYSAKNVVAEFTGAV